MTSWAYRILRQENPGETGLVSDHVCGVAEVFFDDNHEIEAWTGLVKPCGETAGEAVEDLMRMLQGAWNGPLDEAALPRDRKPAWAEAVDPENTISLEEFRARMEAEHGPLEPAEPEPEPVVPRGPHQGGLPGTRTDHGRSTNLRGPNTGIRGIRGLPYCVGGPHAREAACRQGVLRLGSGMPFGTPEHPRLRSSGDSR